jgi:hypothetical protein
MNVNSIRYQLGLHNLPLHHNDHIKHGQAGGKFITAPTKLMMIQGTNTIPAPEQEGYQQIL